MNAVAAKQFLIARVIEEAELQQVLLSDLEKKMLYFTEVHPSLPDIYEINAEFEQKLSMPPSMKTRSQPFLETLVTGTAAYLQFGSKSGRMR